MTRVPEFTAKWFMGSVGGEESWLEHVVPHVKHLPEIRWLEIGSYEGFSALWTAENVLTGPDSRVVCVDPWGWNEDYAEVEKRFDRNTTGDSRIVKMRGTSNQILPLLRDHHYHGCFVDGGHTCECVDFDAREAERLVVPGGFIIFDDYAANENNAIVGGVKEAVDLFLVRMEDKIDVVFKGWQLIVRLKGELV